jgi:hypothetical protein
MQSVVSSIVPVYRINFKAAIEASVIVDVLLDAKRMDFYMDISA